jgi:ParB family chromosome partitioning protein
MTDTIEYLPLSALRESPFNPRKAYPQAELDELADSLKTQGMLQPIVARTRPLANSDPHFNYEIVFGHRNFDETDYTAARLSLAAEHGVDVLAFAEQDDDAGDAGDSDAQGDLLEEAEA